MENTLDEATEDKRRETNSIAIMTIKDKAKLVEEERCSRDFSTTHNEHRPRDVRSIHYRAKSADCGT